ncbi:MAG: ECF transporter S component [Bacilli bacterium]|nr:ECF transporter S component [Acholeplasmataceae bacterium]MDY2902452.1 ECF transporter S component [Bacilli bacterium]
MKKNLVLKIVICGVMAALSIVLEKFSIEIGEIYKITFYGLPLMFTGVMFGYKVGLLTGLVVGFVSQLTSKYGLSPTTPLWMLAPIIWGGMSGFLCCLFKDHAYELKSIAISVFITSLFVTIVNSVVIYLDSIIFQYTSTQAFINIIIKCGIALGMAFVYTFVLFLLCNRLKHLSWLKKDDAF